MQLRQLTRHTQQTASTQHLLTERCWSHHHLSQLCHPNILSNSPIHWDSKKLYIRDTPYTTWIPVLYNLFGRSYYHPSNVNHCQRIHVCAPWKNERIIKLVLLQHVTIHHYWNRKGSVGQSDHVEWILWEVVFTLIDYYTSVEFNLNFSNEVGILATWLTDFPCQTYIDQWPKQH